LSLARKYERLTDLILVADETKRAQEAAQADDKSKQK